MNEANLKVLELTVPCGKFRYHDNGFVESISDETIGVHGLDEFCYDRRQDRLTVGKFCHNGWDLYVFYKDAKSVRDNIRLRAHEETHALDFMCGLDYLSDVLLQNQNVRINFRNIDSREIRAELGALYALRQNGFGPWGLFIDSLLDSDFIMARKIYKKSKQSEKKYFLY